MASGWVVKLGFQRGDVFLDLPVFDDEPIHLGERGVALRDSSQQDHELEEVGVRLLPERLL